MPTRISVLSPHIRHYEWGSKLAIPEYFGWEVTTEPVAEVWLGAHPQGSSLIKGEHSLASEISSDPLLYLGQEVNQRFNGRLPFLMKFLAADSPLSIQVHPNLSQAQEGYEQERLRNVSETDRNYQDPFDKPEQICAISEMWALAGFRSTSEARDLCLQAGLEDVAARLETQSSGEVFLQLLKGSVQVPQKDTLDDLNSNMVENRWVKHLFSLYPEDSAALAPFFMNLLCLQPGQAIFVKAGMVHAYLSGFGVEVMGASDNVLRSGLTRKKMDVVELEKILSLEPESVQVLEPSGSNPKSWESHVAYFKLHQFFAGQARVVGPAIVACTEDSVSLIVENEQLVLRRGEFAYVMGDNDVSIQGSGAAFYCTTNVLGGS